MDAVPGNLPSRYAATTVSRDLAERLDPHRCALIIIDMQNDFCSTDGYVARLGLDVTRLSPLVPVINGFLSVARQADVPVIWLRACYENGLVPPSMLQHKQSRGIEATCCARESWGYEFFGVDPAPDELVLEKHTYSGFSNEELEVYLRSCGIETLLFAGVQTNVCVESTLRDAHSRGFNIVILKDAVGSHTEALHEATLANVNFLFGDVCSTREVADIWASQWRSS